MGIRIDLDDETARRLEALGARHDQSPEAIVRAAVEAYLGLEEPREAQRAEDDRRWQRYLETGEYVSEAEMSRVFDSLRRRVRREAGPS